jgi:hypothetical protein
MPAPPQRSERLLAHLLSNVSRARAELRAIRGNPGSSTDRSDQRQRFADLAESLEAYAAAAAASGVPIPYRYRDEIRLYRSMAVDSRDGRFGRTTQ